MTVTSILSYFVRSSQGAEPEDDVSDDEAPPVVVSHDDGRLSQPVQSEDVSQFARQLPRLPYAQLYERVETMVGRLDMVEGASEADFLPLSFRVEKWEGVEPLKPEESGTEWFRRLHDLLQGMEPWQSLSIDTKALAKDLPYLHFSSAVGRMRSICHQAKQLCQDDLDQVPFGTLMAALHRKGVLTREWLGVPEKALERLEALQEMHAFGVSDIATRPYELSHPDCMELIGKYRIIFAKGVTHPDLWRLVSAHRLGRSDAKLWGMFLEAADPEYRYDGFKVCCMEALAKGETLPQVVVGVVPDEIGDEEHWWRDQMPRAVLGPFYGGDVPLGDSQEELSKGVKHFLEKKSVVVSENKLGSAVESRFLAVKKYIKEQPFSPAWKEFLQRVLWETCLIAIQNMENGIRLYREQGGEENRLKAEAWVSLVGFFGAKFSSQAGDTALGIEVRKRIIERANALGRPVLDREGSASMRIYNAHELATLAGFIGQPVSCLYHGSLVRICSTEEVVALALELEVDLSSFAGDTIVRVAEEPVQEVDFEARLEAARKMDESAGRESRVRSVELSSAAMASSSSAAASSSSASRRVSCPQ